MHRLAIKPIVRKRVEIDRNQKDKKKDNIDENKVSNVSSNIDDDINDIKKQKRQKVPLNDDDDDVEFIPKHDKDCKHDDDNIDNNNDSNGELDKLEKKRGIQDIIVIGDDDSNGDFVKCDIGGEKVQLFAANSTKLRNHSSLLKEKQQSIDINDHEENVRVLLGRNTDSNLKSNDKRKQKDVLISCLVCGTNMDHMDQSKREAHVNRCLDKEQGVAKKKSKYDNNEAIVINSDDDDVFIPTKPTMKDNTKKGTDTKKGVVKQTKLVRSDKGILQVVDIKVTSKDDIIMKSMTPDEQELYTLRLQLGELSNKESEIRSKKIQITKNIKKLTKKINQASDFKLVDRENADVTEVLNMLFPKVETISSQNNNDINNCPLWILAQQHSTFDLVSAGKRIDEKAYLKLEKGDEVLGSLGNDANNNLKDDSNGVPIELCNEKSLLSQFNDMLQQEDINSISENNNGDAIKFLEALLDKDLESIDTEGESIESWLLEASSFNVQDFILRFLHYDGVIDKEMETLIFNNICPTTINANINKSTQMIELLLQEINSGHNHDHEAFLFIARFLLYYIQLNIKLLISSSKSQDHSSSIINIDELNTANGSDKCMNNNNNTILYSAGKNSDSSFSQHPKFSALDMLNDDDNVNEDFYCDADSNDGTVLSRSTSPNYSPVNVNVDNTGIGIDQNTQIETEAIYINSDDEDEPVVPLATRLLQSRCIPIDISKSTQIEYSQKDLKSILSSDVEPDFNNLTVDQIHIIAKNYGLKIQSKQLLVPILKKMWTRMHLSTQHVPMSSEVISSQSSSQIYDVTDTDILNYFKKNENIDFFEKIVNFVPIDLDELHSRMKCQGYHISKEKLKTILSDNSIFFTYGKA